MTSDHSAMNDLDLISLKNVLEKAGIKSVMVEKSDTMPLSALIVQLTSGGDAPESHLNFSFIPLPEDAFPNIKLLQCYTELSMEFKNAKSKTETAAFITALNIRLPAGSFGIRDQQVIYYRYIHTIPKYHVITEDDATFVDLIKLLVYSSRNEIDVLLEVVNGSLSAKDAVQKIEG
jgi:hypothetical protein